MISQVIYRPLSLLLTVALLAACGVADEPADSASKPPAASDIETLKRHVVYTNCRERTFGAPFTHSGPVSVSGHAASSTSGGQMSLWLSAGVTVNLQGYQWVERRVRLRPTASRTSINAQVTLSNANTNIYLWPVATPTYATAGLQLRMIVRDDDYNTLCRNDRTLIEDYLYAGQIDTEANGVQSIGCNIIRTASSPEYVTVRVQLHGWATTGGFIAVAVTEADAAVAPIYTRECTEALKVFGVDGLCLQQAGGVASLATCRSSYGGQYFWWDSATSQMRGLYGNCLARNGSDVTVTSCSSDTAQRWRRPSGSDLLISASSWDCLEARRAPGRSDYVGASLHVAHCRWTPEMRWFF